MKIDLTKPASQEAFGQLIDVSQPMVSDLCQRGILPKGGSAGTWLKAYCSHMREIAAGRSASGELSLISERARLAKEQADRLAMQNAQKRGEIAPILVIEEALARAGAQIGALLDAIPAQLKRRGSFKATDINFVAGVLAQARNVAADMEVDVDDLGDAAEHSGRDAPGPAVAGHDAAADAL